MIHLADAAALVKSGTNKIATASRTTDGDDVEGTAAGNCTEPKGAPIPKKKDDNSHPNPKALEANSLFALESKDGTAGDTEPKGKAGKDTDTKKGKNGKVPSTPLVPSVEKTGEEPVPIRACPAWPLEEKEERS